MVDEASLTIHISDYYTSNIESCDSSSGDSSSDDYSSDDDDMGDDESILSDPTMANITDTKEFLEGNPTTDGEVKQKLNKYIVEEINKLVALLAICEKSMKTSYDPNLKEGNPGYRQMFPRVGKFKEVVPIDDPDTMKLINRLICLQFPKCQYNALHRNAKQAAIEIMQIALETNLKLMRQAGHPPRLQSLL
ncbi:hypothetical protein KI688_008498 [Linnemannia hyalina]|uniref:Uncharacterized protein n=1 Tax=Linnemannia hyalina TaxID=64524 RepID=A0A9P7Y105_9FUNG|nr:hypothetical protein KI688_008498 [Linnemannia hyalina]